VTAAALDGEALVGEALRVNARYVEEIVIGWGLCPWAARAWNDGQVARRVFTAAQPDVTAVAAFIAELAAKADAAIGLAIFPHVACNVGAWEKFAEQVRRGGGAFLTAAFHPDYGTPDEAGGDGPLEPARLVPFIRRTPDPTLQLVRASLIDGLRGDVSDEVARDNHATIAARGVPALEALLTDIRRDRDAAYARALSAR
jgi:hypothetical protein